MNDLDTLRREAYDEGWDDGAIAGLASGIGFALLVAGLIALAVFR